MMFRELKRFIKSKRASLFRKWVKRRATYHPVSQSSALIIAPHPDDEILGCGGLIALKKSKNAQVDIVFITQGEASHQGCCALKKEHVGQVRQQLAIESLRVIGLKEENTHWVGLSDGQIPLIGEEKQLAVTRLHTLIMDIQPQEIYVPHYLDSWQDHRATAAITHAALSQYQGVLYYYPIWIWYIFPFKPLLPALKEKNIIRVDITPVMEQKQKAIAHYMSKVTETCGKPYCGNLPKEFLQHFNHSYETFFQSNK